jgi:N-acetylglutamate synthase-like GNAT family acetyltransferase
MLEQVPLFRRRTRHADAGCETATVQLLSSTPEHQAALEAFLRQFNTLRVARRGVLVDALDHPTVLALSEGELVGVATYMVQGDSCELLTLHTTTRGVGVGSALLAAVQDAALDAGCQRLWVVTTNDNLEALRFYQRRGFCLALLRPGAVDRSRELLKPAIPTSGAHDIPLRDELELEMTLDRVGG